MKYVTIFNEIGEPEHYAPGPELLRACLAFTGRRPAHTGPIQLFGDDGIVYNYTTLYPHGLYEVDVWHKTSIRPTCSNYIKMDGYYISTGASPAGARKRSVNV